MEKSRVSIVGLGKLGACMAASIADKGFGVIGVDVTPRMVDLLNQGQAPVLEPGLQELIASNRSRLRATLDYREAIPDSDITFVVVPTPSESHGGFSLKYVVQVAREAGRALAAKQGYHLFVLTSTVLPGSTQFSVLPAIEEASGKRCGVDFGLCYSPEFIALGSVIRNFLNPDFVLIGESDKRAGQKLADFYQGICDNRPPVARMSFENAELTKIAINTYATMKIGFANMLAEICERIPGGDVDVVTSALGLDSRIGPKYLKGALGYGGPCFPRDNLALGYFARRLGCQDVLARATDHLNRLQPERITEILKNHLKPGATVAILGLSYKPHTPVVEESQSLAIAQRLAATGHPVVAHDVLPQAMDNARQILGNSPAYAASVKEAVEKAEAVVIASQDPETLSALTAYLAGRQSPLVIFDCWRSLQPEQYSKEHFNYVSIGAAVSDQQAAQILAGLWR